MLGMQLRQHARQPGLRTCCQLAGLHAGMRAAACAGSAEAVRFALVLHEASEAACLAQTGPDVGVHQVPNVLT